MMWLSLAALIPVARLALSARVPRHVLGHAGARRPRRTRRTRGVAFRRRRRARPQRSRRHRAHDRQSSGAGLSPAHSASCWWTTRAVTAPQMPRAPSTNRNASTFSPARRAPPGWTGKLWAVSQGIARAGTPDYLWLTDADIAPHARQSAQARRPRPKAASSSSPRSWRSCIARAGRKPCSFPSAG